MVALPRERIMSKSRFVLEARVKFWINKYNAVKLIPVVEIESGLSIILTTDSDNLHYIYHYFNRFLGFAQLGTKLTFLKESSF
jgi:hypothetical protein